jgi:hypothetical protein
MKWDCEHANEADDTCNKAVTVTEVRKTEFRKIRANAARVETPDRDTLAKHATAAAGPAEDRLYRNTARSIKPSGLAKSLRTTRSTRSTKTFEVATQTPAARGAGEIDDDTKFDRNETAAGQHPPEAP